MTLSRPSGLASPSHLTMPRGLPKRFSSLPDERPGERAEMGAIGRAYVVREHNVEQLARTLATVLFED
jgi:hypothetical protein